MELVKLASTSRARPRVHHFRTTTGREVDIVLEAPDGRIVGVEVKASSSVGADAFKGMDALADAAGPRFHRGVVLYGGDQIVPFGTARAAVPFPMLWL